jgi:hypothetical protein
MASLLDDVLPGYDVNELHGTFVPAPPAAAWAATRAVTPLEVRLLLPLLLVRLAPGALLARRFPPLGPRSPVIDAMQRFGFLMLGERPGEEVVLGVAGRFWELREAQAVRPLHSTEDFAAFDEPASAKAALNFIVGPEAGGSRVITETRIAGTDAEGSRRFHRYWRLAMPGSAAIRRSWLAAIRRRAAR